MLSLPLVVGLLLRTRMRLDPLNLLDHLENDLIAALKEGSSLELIKPGAKLSAMVEAISVSAALRDYETLNLGTLDLLEVARLGHFDQPTTDEAEVTWEIVLKYVRDLGVSLVADAMAAEVVVENLEFETRRGLGGLTYARVGAAHEVFAIGRYAARQRFEAAACSALESLGLSCVFAKTQRSRHQSTGPRFQELQWDG